MSCQPRPQPQASGTAASTASRGTATKSPTRNRSRRLLGSGSTSGRGVRVRAAPSGFGVGGSAGTVAVVVIAGPRSASGATGGWIRLRHRNLRNRKLRKDLTQSSPRSGVENIGRALSVSPSEMTCRRSAAGGVVDPGPGAWRVVVPGQPQQRLETLEPGLEPGLPREDALPVRPEDLQVGRPEVAVDGVRLGEQAGRPPAVVHGADRERAGRDAVDPVAGRDRGAVGDQAPDLVDDRCHVRQRQAKQRELGHTVRVPEADAVGPRRALLVTGDALDRPADPADVAHDDLRVGLRAVARGLQLAHLAFALNFGSVHVPHATPGPRHFPALAGGRLAAIVGPSTTTAGWAGAAASLPVEFGAATNSPGSSSWQDIALWTRQRRFESFPGSWRPVRHPSSLSPVRLSGRVIRSACGRTDPSFD